jgi:hypothetical protein
MEEQANVHKSPLTFELSSGVSEEVALRDAAGDGDGVDVTNQVVMERYPAWSKRIVGAADQTWPVTTDGERRVFKKQPDWR